MKWSIQKQQSAENIEQTKHSKTDSYVNSQFIVDK